MIGQKQLLRNVDRQFKVAAPAFTILVGPEKSGKTLIAKHIAQTIGAQLITCGNKVDEIREAITLAYKQGLPSVYLISHADRMSSAARNALLKVTEEPPRQAYFIMTMYDISNTLDTLRSRASVFFLQPYTPEEVMEYSKSKDYQFSVEVERIVKQVCLVPGDVDRLMQYDVLAFYDFTKKVAEFIQTVSGANAFKIGTKISFKAGEPGWDIFIFIRILMLVYLDFMRLQPSYKWAKCIEIVSKYNVQLNSQGINQQATLDMLILELRGVKDACN